MILVCVKGYSLDSTVPFIQKITKKTTIVIPILNIYGTGRRLQEKLPGILVTDGCIYVSANIEGPGALVQHGKILRVVFGVREKSEFREELKEIAKDFNDSGISGELSENIRRDALEKFSYVSPIGAAGLYYHATAADFQREGEEREAFKAMIRAASREKIQKSCPVKVILKHIEQGLFYPVRGGSCLHSLDRF